MLTATVEDLTEKPCGTVVRAGAKMANIVAAAPWWADVIKRPVNIAIQATRPAANTDVVCLLVNSFRIAYVAIAWYAQIRAVSMISTAQLDVWVVQIYVNGVCSADHLQQQSVT